MNFSFYQADTDYCNFLRNSDHRVPYTMEQKSTRPFIGIVITVNGHDFYAPLTSPKPKHRTMKTQLDFIKIKNGEWGAINFNNMIPIGKASRTPVEIDLLPNDTHAEKAYKELLSNQLSWCNQTVNGTAILSKAEKLYHIIVSGKGHEALRQRCCDFQLLEEKCSEWERLHPSIELQNTVPTKTQIKSEMSFIERLEQAKQEANRRNEAKQQSRNFTHTIEK